MSVSKNDSQIEQESENYNIENKPHHNPESNDYMASRMCQFGANEIK